MKKGVLTILLAGLVALAASGCGGSSKSDAAVETAASMGTAVAEAPAATEEAAEMEYDSGAGEVTSENGIEPVAETGRKLIRNVNLELQTREFDTLMDGLSKKVQEMGGYIQGSSIWGSSYYQNNNRSADYTVRIPSDRLDEFIEVVSGLGNVTYKNESVEDVTLQYVDTESRKKALETEQERLLVLMEQAENLEDLLTIESRLSEVRYELENYGSQLRLLDNQIDYSTVYINIQEVERITESKDRTFFEEVSVRFGDNVYEVGRGLRSFAIGFLSSLPILAVWAVPIVILVLILRRIFRGGKAKRKKPWEREPARTEDEPEDSMK